MSHFTVLVIGDDVEGALAPFQENNMGDCPKEYLEFHSHEEELKKDWEANEDTVKSFYPEHRINVSKEEYENFGKTGVMVFLNKEAEFCHIIKDGDKVALHVEGTDYDECLYGTVSDTVEDSTTRPRTYSFKATKIERTETKIRDFYKDFDAYATEHCGYRKDEEKGEYGYWENPNAKWDWYALGGRWAGKLRLKPNAKGVHGDNNRNMFKAINGEALEPYKPEWVDQARKGDIDFEEMARAYAKNAEETYDKFLVEYEEAKAKGEEEGNKAGGMAYFMYGVHNTSEDRTKFIPESREAYVKRCTGFSTFAVLKDGKWYEKGEMGWWWMEEYQKLLADLPDDTLLSVIDCHI